AFVALLVRGLEPVPAARRMRGRRLLNEGDDAAFARGELAHARPGREVVRGLVAAVQHDDQRPAPAEAPPGSKDLVLACARAVGVAPRLDAAPFQPRQHYLSDWRSVGKILGVAAT